MDSVSGSSSGSVVAAAVVVAGVNSVSGCSSGCYCWGNDELTV
jgi:hypothetical protein